MIDLADNSDLGSGSTDRWINPVAVKELVGNAAETVIEGLSPTTGDAYLASAVDGDSTIDGTAAAVGDIFEYDGANFQKIVTNVGGFPPAGTRAILSTQTALIAPYTDAADDGQVVNFDGTSLTGASTGEAVDGTSVVINGDPSVFENNAYTFDGTVPTGTWTQTTAAPAAHAIASHSDTTATGAELETLTDGSNADSLHDHAANVVQTGTPVDDFITGADGAAGAAGSAVGTLGGDGGDGTTGGGVGGAASATGGDGGDSSTSGNAGGGGAASNTGGKGGAANGASGNGGAGGSVELGAGAGGTSANATGGTGGEANLLGGDGADSQGGTSTAGAGGAAAHQSGNGGAGSGANAGGVGGNIVCDAGSGGNSGSSSNGGAGGTAASRAGTGGTVSSGTGTGGAGGAWTGGGGAAGNSSTTATSNPGAGGAALLRGGTGGNSQSGAGTNGGAGGDVTIRGGAGGTSADASAGADGDVNIGQSDTAAINSGNATDKPKWIHTGALYTPTKDLGAFNAATATANLLDSNNFKMSIQGACTLAFSNTSDGQTGKIQVTHDGASATLAKGANVTFPGGTLTLSAGSGDIDVLSYLVEGTNIRVWAEALDFS